MFCPNCGNEIKPGAKFCNGCGQPVVVKSEEDNKSEEIESKEQPVKKSVEKKYTGFIVLLVVLGIVFVGLVVAYFTIDAPQIPPDDNTESTNGEATELSDENILTSGYWYSDYIGNILFRRVENNSTFNGIVIMDEEDEVFPYKLDENGNITVYLCEYTYHETTDSYDYTYEPYFEIEDVKTSEEGNRFFQTSVSSVVIQFNNIVVEEYSDELLLKFDEWSDYDYKAKSVDEYSDYLFRNSITEEAQRDVHFYSFYDFGYNSDEYNMIISTDVYGAEDQFNTEESFDEIYSIDSDENCIYIGDDKYQFYNDAAYLYCEETGHTIYRITDFVFGKIADTDFPPGEFVE